MRINIETNKKFTFRLEDYVYSVVAIVFSLTGLFLFIVFKNNFSESIMLGIVFSVLLVLIGIFISLFLIYRSYISRKNDEYYIEENIIVKTRNGKIIFEIPLTNIQSIRVYNKKGKQGSILIFTNVSSRNMWFTLIPFLVRVPLSLYGLTKNKINLAIDRKLLIMEIYSVNSKIHFIETH